MQPSASAPYSNSHSLESPKAERGITKEKNDAQEGEDKKSKEKDAQIVSLDKFYKVTQNVKHLGLLSFTCFAQKKSVIEKIENGLHALDIKIKTMTAMPNLPKREEVTAAWAIAKHETLNQSIYSRALIQSALKLLALLEKSVMQCKKPVLSVAAKITVSLLELCCDNFREELEKYKEIAEKRLLRKYAKEALQVYPDFVLYAQSQSVEGSEVFKTKEKEFNEIKKKMFTLGGSSALQELTCYLWNWHIHWGVNVRDDEICYHARGYNPKFLSLFADKEFTRIDFAHWFNVKKLDDKILIGQALERLVLQLTRALARCSTQEEKESDAYKEMLQLLDPALWVAKYDSEGAKNEIFEEGISRAYHFFEGLFFLDERKYFSEYKKVKENFLDEKCTHKTLFEGLELLFKMYRELIAKGHEVRVNNIKENARVIYKEYLRTKYQEKRLLELESFLIDVLAQEHTRGTTTERLLGAGKGSELIGYFVLESFFDSEKLEKLKNVEIFDMQWSTIKDIQKKLEEFQSSFVLNSVFLALEKFLGKKIPFETKRLISLLYKPQEGLVEFASKMGKAFGNIIPEESKGTFTIKMGAAITKARDLVKSTLFEWYIRASSRLGASEHFTKIQSQELCQIGLGLRSVMSLHFETFGEIYARTFQALLLESSNGNKSGNEWIKIGESMRVIPTSLRTSK